MSAESLILCGGVPWKKTQKGCLRLQVDPRSIERNINLKISDISTRLTKDVPDLLLDLLELATYVYCGDQSFSRGGEVGSEQGARWRRTLHFVVPVRCPEIWRSPRVSSALNRALGFLSDEEFVFHFRQLRDPVLGTGYFEFGPGEDLGGKVEEVILYSGGLDSLAGVMREAVMNRTPVALVSHRSTPKMVRFREQLVQEVSKLCRGLPPYHIPVWAHKSGLKSRENTQRTRTFLYASLATVVARLYDLQRIRFYENGITSLNLPISAQLIGSRASRSTHPRALQLFSQFFTELMGEKFTVENPGFWQTKTDIINEIAEAGGAHLIKRTRSCHHTQDATKVHTHCGRCSQCVGRRLSVLATRHSNQDPAEMYKSDPLTAHTEEGEERVIAESYPRFASEIEPMSDKEFFERSGELGSAFVSFEGPIDRSATLILDLYRRHARQISSALDGAISTNAPAIRRRKIPPTSLLGMVLSAIPRITREESAKSGTETEYFRPSSDYRTVRYRGQDLSVRPAAADIIRVMHQEFIMTKVPIISVPVIRQALNLEGDFIGNLRHCDGVWKVIVGPGGKGKVKFLVLPHPDSREFVFRSEE